MPHLISNFKPFSLSNQDLEIIGCDHSEFIGLLKKVEGSRQQYIENVGARLMDLDWLKRKIDAETKRDASPFFSEGLFSLQIYLLVTCADTLGHISCREGRPTERVQSFFSELPESSKHCLTNTFRVWMTKQSEPIAQNHLGRDIQHMKIPSKNQIFQIVESLSAEKRFSNIVQFLADYRHWFTHEADYPKLGRHPNLKVLHAMRLGVPNVASLGELDHTQIMIAGKEKYYVVYYDTDDPIAELRKTIVQGLGRIVEESPS
jgi:hypothetical protein